MFVYSPFEVLLEAAEKIKLKLPFEKSTPIEKGYSDKLLEPIMFLFKTPAYHSTSDVKYFTAPYEARYRRHFEPFFNKVDLDQTLSPTTRSMLTFEILDRTSYLAYEKPSGDEERNAFESRLSVGVERLIGQGILEAAYPLHEEIDANYWGSLENEANDRTVFNLSFCGSHFTQLA